MNNWCDKHKKSKFLKLLQRAGGSIFFPLSLVTFHSSLLTAVLLVTCHLSLVTAASAQDDELAPPPLRTVTKEERIALDSQPDVKARTKLALIYMTGHMATAEALSARHDYDAMFRELGGFQGLLDNTLVYLTAGDKKSGKVLDNLKRFEIGIREFMPRLEVIHRELPFRYEDYVRRLLAFVRNARTKALDPLFSDTVVKNSDE